MYGSHSSIELKGTELPIKQRLDKLNSCLSVIMTAYVYVLSKRSKPLCVINNIETLVSTKTGNKIIREIGVDDPVAKQIMDDFVEYIKRLTSAQGIDTTKIHFKLISNLFSNDPIITSLILNKKLESDSVVSKIEQPVSSVVIPAVNTNWTSRIMIMKLSDLLRSTFVLQKINLDPSSSGWNYINSIESTMDAKIHILSRDDADSPFIDNIVGYVLMYINNEYFNLAYLVGDPNNTIVDFSLFLDINNNFERIVFIRSAIQNAYSNDDKLVHDVKINDSFSTIIQVIQSLII